MTWRLPRLANRIWKTTGKEVVFGLVFPLAVAVTVFYLFWIFDNRLTSLPSELFKKQLFGTVVAPLVFFAFSIYLAVIRPMRKYKILRLRAQTWKIVRRAADSPDLRATSTIPLADWFKDPIYEYLVREVIHCAISKADHVRILLFDGDDLEYLQSPDDPDAQLARHLATLHQMGGMKLYFLRKKDLEAALKGLLTKHELVIPGLKPNGLGMGARWKSLLDFCNYTNSGKKREVASFDFYAPKRLHASTKEIRVALLEAAYDEIASMCIDSDIETVREESNFINYVLSP